MITLGMTNQHDIIRDKLKELLDLNICHYSYNSGVQITISSTGFDIIILNAPLTKPHLKDYFWNSNSLVILDPKFKHLMKVLLDKPEKSHPLLSRVFSVFSKVNKLSDQEIYILLFNEKQKEGFAISHGLPFSPYQEYFMFANNELKSRYTKASILPENFHLFDNRMIKILDSSAYLVEKNGKRSIELISNGVVIKNRVYNQNILEMVKTTPEKSTSFISNRTGKIEHYRERIKKGIKLKNELSYPVTRVNFQDFKLRVINGLFFLEDSLGLIDMNHDDLSIIVLNQ